MSISSLTKYRNIWLGLAVSWIVIYHSGLTCSNGVIMMIKQMGTGGVDICIFASGLGCYMSLKKNCSLLSFYKRRLIRIVPVWLCFCPVWILFRLLHGGISIRDAVGNLLMVQYYTGHEPLFNWYIGAIWMFYLLAPLFFEIITSFSTKGNRIVFGLIIIFSLAFCSFDMNTAMVLIARIPIFYIGMYVGKIKEKEERKIKRGEIAFIILLGIGASAIYAYFRQIMPGAEFETTGIAFYSYIPITIAFCFIVSVICHILEQRCTGFWKMIDKTIGTAGNCSLEVYVVHILVYEWLGTVIAYKSWKEWAFAILLVIPCVTVLHMASKQVRGWMSCR